MELSMNPLCDSTTFDGYCAAVREATLSFVLTRPAVGKWGLDLYSDESMVVQFGSDGGASIADGIARGDAYVLMCRNLPTTAEITLNGNPIGEDDFVVLPPNSHFIFSATAPRTWISVSLTKDMTGSFWRSDQRQATKSPDSRPFVIKSDAITRATLLSAAENYRQARVLPVKHADSRAVGARLVQTSLDILSSWQGTERNKGRDKNADALAHVSRAFRALHAEELGDGWYVGDLAKTVNVAPRTLFRDFNRIIGMGPVRYLKLRQLNQLRRELLATTRVDVHVTEFMKGVGVSEFGRTAGAYKALFGELPSETLQRAQTPKCIPIQTIHWPAPNDLNRN